MQATIKPSNFPAFVAAGEALTDMIRTANLAGADAWTSKVGGATWNVARVMANLGIDSGFAGAISKDLFGDALWSASQAAGLDLRFLQRVDKSPLLAMVYETEPPKYFFVGDDSADLYFDPAQLPQGWQQQVQWVHFCGISLARQPLAATLLAMAAALKDAGVKISYDPNFRSLMDERYDVTFQKMASLADVIKVSDEDLVGLFRHDDLASSLLTLRSWNPDAAILYTRGAAGASLHIGAQLWQASPPMIKVVDSVGAGDASIGGLLFSMIRFPERSWDQHLRFSVAAGAAACLAIGAVPPDLALIDSLY